jgi:hypothetical protein
VGTAQRHRLAAHVRRFTRLAECARRAFLTQLRRYRSGEPLANVVDKDLGFVAGG